MKKVNHILLFILFLFMFSAIPDKGTLNYPESKEQQR